jgi:hypothetical protein
LPTWECGDSGTVGVTFLPSRSAVEGLRFFAVLCTGCKHGHVTPFRLLHSNLGLLCVNLLKREQLREKWLGAGCWRAPPGYRR